MRLVNSALTEDVPDDHYGTTYEVFVYSFADSDGDGIGDLNGLRENLGYINDGDPLSDLDLGANAIWLMPIFPSPTYHKYDAVNYMDIDPEYGTLEDFDALLAACHERGVEPARRKGSGQRGVPVCVVLCVLPGEVQRLCAAG